MITQISSTIELNPELANLAMEIGLNVQKICENALKSAIAKLQGSNVKSLMVDEAGFEPATSTMPTWRSYQADLLAQIADLSERLTHNFRLKGFPFMPRILGSAGITVLFSWFSSGRFSVEF
jgi:hypothetical protein